ncbi:NAD(P)H oxidoreductase [Haemophilus influenzae]|uniref:NAD(P)H oxidoreductase n=1 Tax=Haemophilus influenzae TaxID=727 RepID=A0A2X1PTW0_HAEIF|nr:NAD(P)H oxidoreductase [Haemophilus influenzae]
MDYSIIVELKMSSFELFGDIHLIDDEARKAMIELAAQKTQAKLTALLKEKRNV